MIPWRVCDLRKTMKKIKKIFGFLMLIIIFFVMVIMYISIKYPIGYNNIIKRYSSEYNLDPYLVASIINVESRYDKQAISPKLARGLMQISPQTGEWASKELNIEDYSEDELYDPETNIRIGSWYLDRLGKEFKNDFDHILIAYNAGSGNLSKWLNEREYSEDGKIISIPFKETENYLKRVKTNYKVYKLFYKNYFEINSKMQLEENIYINLLNNIKDTVKNFVKY